MCLIVPDVRILNKVKIGEVHVDPGHPSNRTEASSLIVATPVVKIRCPRGCTRKPKRNEQKWLHY